MCKASISERFNMNYLTTIFMGKLTRINDGDTELHSTGTLFVIK